MEDRTEMTQQILNITLDILYLLTGEDYIIVKKPGGRTPNSRRLQVVEGFCRQQSSILVPPPCSLTSERSEEKILELTNKMVELLTGEVPIRCQDVTVYFSMEEWEYLEGHKELYKDVMMEDHQTEDHLTLPTPDGSEGRHTSGDDVGLSMVASDCETGDGMIIDAGPEGIDPCEGDTGPEGIDPCEGDTGPEGIDPCEGDTGPEGIDPYEGDSGLEGINPYEDTGPIVCEGDTGPEGVDSCEEDMRDEGVESCKGDTTTSSLEGFHIRIKEEPLSDDEDGFTEDFAKQIPYTCVRIKDEPHPYEDIRIPSDDTYADQTPQAFGHFKVETVPDEEDGRSTPNVYTSTDRGHSTHVHVKEEPTAPISVRDVSRQENQTRPQPSNSLQETFAYKVEIPADKAPAKGPDNASLYSVRQKENSMEILYHCPSCYKGFSSNLDLARHQVIHTVDKLFICSLCGKSFTEMSFLVKHQVIHTDLKLCVCPVCGGCFYSETSLAKHQKTHSVPLFCSTCSKCFFNKTELAIHERKHSGERPFGCHICGKHFIAKSVLNKHMLIHPTMHFKK